jgi:hypothetical protein
MISSVIASESYSFSRTAVSHAIFRGWAKVRRLSPLPKAGSPAAAPEYRQLALAGAAAAGMAPSSRRNPR